MTKPLRFTVMVTLSFSLLMNIFISPAAFSQSATSFADRVGKAEFLLRSGKLLEARGQIDRLLERDQKSIAAWNLRFKWAEAQADKDEMVYALHKQLQLSMAQNIPKNKQKEIRDRLLVLDPVADEYLGLSDSFVDRLSSVADQYEKEKRPHSAIRVYQEILALDPEHKRSLDKIEKISSSPDPSLAETAKPKDLLEDYSQEFIEKRSLKHSTWKTRDEWPNENYITQTDAGFGVMIRASEAMEQMNAFYREFFQYGTKRDGKSVPRIFLKIFKNKDEYLKHGSSPAEWSGGQFTGSAVETFISSGGFEGMTGVLFHEAAHQFVGLATSAVGWLNEGLASFFEGTRILANGTVIMNLPATHRLFPLVDRMEKGWMTTHDDGIDPSNASQTPQTSPTFRIVLENKYQWGPPWYAPTWGVVYFLYNYQDPVDGRFVYRAGFRDYINASGGLQGDTAVEKFEETVLFRPTKPTSGVDFSSSPYQVDLPRTVDELNEVWKTWLIRLRDEQSGRTKVEKPYLDWARYAIKRKDWTVAKEHFEKGMLATPENVDILFEFAELLEGRFKNPDRATKLALQSIRVIEQSADPDPDRIKAIERQLAKWDPKRSNLEKVHEQIRTRAEEVVEGYLAQGFPMMAMDVSWRFGSDLKMPGMFDLFEKAARDSGKTLALWKLAYNEENLKGWSVTNDSSFRSDSTSIHSRYGDIREGDFSYRFLTLDTVTSGDFSMEAEIQSTHGKNTFSGLVFGKKGDSNFHALIYFPGQTRYTEDRDVSATGYVDLASFYGNGNFKTWRHNPVETSTSDWHKFKVDVIGSMVDVWFDGNLVVSQDFNTTDVLRGNFGLITGPGEARYRNIRYLSRPSRDPGARIEREIRLEKAGGESGGLTPSMVGKVPPFPKVEEWLQEPRHDWKEKGFVPTVLVFWSMEQNDIIATDEWLRDFAIDYEDIGLQVVSIAQADGKDKVQSYLEEYPLPGSVAVDSRVMAYFGETFEEYLIGEAYNLPRVILLDIDQRVVWEGDPGYSSTEPYEPGKESYVEGPLNDLIARRKLKELASWQEDWESRGQEAFASYDMKVVAPLLLEARGLPAIVPAVGGAKKRFRDIEDALNSLPRMAADLAEAGAEPALSVLINWATLLDIETDAAVLKELKKTLNSKNSAAWKKAVRQFKPIRKKVAKTKNVSNAEQLLRRLETLDGTFPKMLREKLAKAIADNDLERTLQIIDDGAEYPTRWLFESTFGWTGGPGN